jgi:hypothetical protein
MQSTVEQYAARDDRRLVPGRHVPSPLAGWEALMGDVIDFSSWRDDSDIRELFRTEAAYLIENIRDLLDNTNLPGHLVAHIMARSLLQDLYDSDELPDELVALQLGQLPDEQHRHQ